MRAGKYGEQEHTALDKWVVAIGWNKVPDLSATAIKGQVDDSPAFFHRKVALPKKGQEIASFMDEYSVRYHSFTQAHLDGPCHLSYKGKMYISFSQNELTAYKTPRSDRAVAALGRGNSSRMFS
jgi:hypothetical protein